jgi:hypothetical protein
MVEGTPGESKRKRGRSPSYPGIDLGEALDRARTLYEKEGRNAAPVSAIYGHWGYGANTGPGMIALAALKKFGLLVDEGSGAGRKARLSDDALRILLDEREDTFGRLERQRAIQEAALKPAIHAELWGRYGSALPSDATLRFELQTERAFTKRGVEEFIPQFKSTLAFAQLTGRAKLSGSQKDKEEDESESPMAPPTTLVDTPVLPKPKTEARQPRVVQLPISASEWAALQAPFPLTESQWQQMLTVLDAMKAGLVESKNGEASHQEEASE